MRFSDDVKARPRELSVLKRIIEGYGDICVYNVYMRPTALRGFRTKEMIPYRVEGK